MMRKVLDEITIHFTNLDGATVEIWEEIIRKCHPPIYSRCNYLSTGLILIIVKKRATGDERTEYVNSVFM